MSSSSTDIQLQMLLGSTREVLVANQPGLPERASPRSRRQAFATFALLSGASLMIAVTVVAGSGAFFGEQPAPWTHGLLAVIVAQSAILLGVALKPGKSQTRRRAPSSQSRFEPTLKLETGGAANLPTLPQAGSAIAPPPLVVQRGQIGERAFKQYSDGSLEVETLLGRRRFPSFDAAEEFVLGKTRSAVANLAA